MKIAFSWRWKSSDMGIVRSTHSQGTETMKKSMKNTGWLALGLLTSSVTMAAPQLRQIERFTSPTSIVELIYARDQDALVLRNSGSAVIAVDLESRTGAIQLANSLFTDMDLSPDGRYVYAGDYGYENTGYGTPASQHYVHRLDLASNTWETRTTAHIAGRIEAISGDRFVLSSLDQWTTFSYNSWDSENSTTILNPPAGWWSNGFYSGVYHGDIEYDATTGRVIHGNSGVGSQEIAAFSISGNSFSRQEESGLYGSAQGYGGSVVLSTDSSRFYYGQLQVNALDVTDNLHVFPETILAANGSYAFSATGFYDAATGIRLGDLGFTASVFGLDGEGLDFWAFDNTAKVVRHLEFISSVPEPQSAMMLLAGLVVLAQAHRTRRVKEIGTRQ